MKQRHLESGTAGGSVAATHPDVISGQSRVTGSIIVPAHNEQAVIGRTLAPLAGLADEGVEIVVCANGCSDATVATARAAAPAATVLDLPEPSKARAIRAAERTATRLPRLFVDADVVVTRRAALETLRALSNGAVAARPPIAYDTSGATWPVRRYYRARRAMPSMHRHAWGAGVYGLSEAARARFGEFPDLVGDDLWVDRLLAPGELQIVDTDPVLVSTPRNSRSLLNILRRAQRVKDERAAAGEPEATELQAGKDLVSVARSSVGGVIDAAVYATFAGLARAGLRSRKTVRWERDETSRIATS